MRTQLAFRITPSDVRFTSFTTEVTKHAKTDPCVWPWASVHSLAVFGAAQRRASKGGARKCERRELTGCLSRYHAREAIEAQPGGAPDAGNLHVRFDEGEGTQPPSLLDWFKSWAGARQRDPK